jgi:hypothetical protein
VSADDLALYRRMTALYEQALQVRDPDAAERLLDEMDKVWLRMTDEERNQLSREEGTQA